jgi:peptidylglycine monooxygenase
LVETYLCTPIKLNDTETHYVIGFKPNATSHTAHHVLIYGCEEPGSDTLVYNCGEMAVQQPGEFFF